MESWWQSNIQWFMTYKSRIKCCFSLNYCQFCVYFLLWCCRVAIWPPCTFPCTRVRSPQFLSAKFLCFGFASTNHIARNHIDKTVYGPHWCQRNGRYHTVNERRLFSKMNFVTWRSSCHSSYYRILNRILKWQELRRVASVYWKSLCDCNLHSTNSYSS